MTRQLVRVTAALACGVTLGLAGGGAPAAEPGRPAWDRDAARHYLDGRVTWWRDWSSAARGQGTSCVSCHTGLPFALAAPDVNRTPGESEKALLDGVKKRVANWEAIVAGEGELKPYYGGNKKAAALGTESVLNALILVNQDVRRNGGTLTDAAQRALALMLAQQQDNGGWAWLDFGLRPWEEKGEYFGAALAAVAAGMADQGQGPAEGVQEKVGRLRRYLRDDFAGQSLHHRIFALWASTKMDGILAAEQKKQLIEELFAAQDADGGWSLTSLGQTRPGAEAWPRKGAVPADARGDGYSTGLVVFVLRQAGVNRDHEKLKAATAWLIRNQKEGTWPILYVNKDRDPSSNPGKFLGDAGAAFAVLALRDLE